ncbi:hypothetical protein D8T65_10325 [Vibrio vulnificus]|nr:hypothetical protein D8T65_10325 [Vibrio vulnificus]
MRMSEKFTSNASYGWSGLVAIFGSVSADTWMVIISLIGVLITAFINNYWQKKRFKAEFGNGQS